MPLEAAVPMSGKRVALRPLSLRYVEGLHAIATCPSAVGRWRLAGETMRLNDFATFLWKKAGISMVVVRRRDECILGLVQAYDLDTRSGTCAVAVLIDEVYWGAGWPLEGLILFINYLFMGVGLRKLYFHIPEFNRYAFRNTMGRWLTREGVLKDARYYDGGLHDVHVMALWRREWDEDACLKLTGNVPRSQSP